MKARALAFSRTSEVLGRAPSRVSDLIRPVQPGPPRPPRAELASRKLQVRRLGSRGRPQSCRRLPAEMPGKKARKNAQPSPARAPAGRDLMGRRSWPGRGGRDGVEVSIGAGSARLLGASGSGLVCALARAFGAPRGSPSGGFIQDRGDGEGGTQVWDWDAAVFQRVQKASSPAFHPHLPCPGHGEEQCKCGCQQPGESHCHGRWGREKLWARPGLPAIPKTGLLLRSPGPWRARR